MSDRVRKQWEALGSRDPYWAVLTHRDKRGARWDKEQFFQTGIAEIEDVERRLVRLGLAPKRELALDYGCGVGRLTRAIGRRYARVLGVDISEAMLQEARAIHLEHPHLEFRRGSGRNLAFVDNGSVDFIYSNIALQHSPPDVQRDLIGELCRVLAPGGVLVFQTPSHANLRKLAGCVHSVLGNLLLYIPRRILYGKHGVMELHAVHRRRVLELLAARGLAVVDVERYDAAGPAFVSYRYYATRRA